MLKIRALITITLLFAIYSCETPHSVFKNNNKSCILNMYSNNEYSFSYPVFIGSNKNESGTYQYQGDKIILTRKEENDLPNIDVHYTSSEDNPKHLTIKFKNLNKKKIDVKFKINNSSEYFETKSGKYTLSYSELENKEIMKINSFTFYYKDIEYLKNMKDFQDSRKPNILEFELNEFKGQKFAFLNREYLIRNDSIFINDISAKVTGVNHRCLVKK